MSKLLNSTLGKIVLAVGFLVAAAIAWVLISPLFINRTVDETLPEISSAAASEPMVLAAGAFVDADAVHKGSGDVKVVELADGERVLRFEDFEGTNGPDLFVWLTNVDDPQADRRMIGEEGKFVDLGRLKGNVGSQNYALPADLDLAEFDHVVVWCRAFGVLFSSATLTEF